MSVTVIALPRKLCNSHDRSEVEHVTKGAVVEVLPATLEGDAAEHDAHGSQTARKCIILLFQPICYPCADFRVLTCCSLTENALQEYTYGDAIAIPASAPRLELFCRGAPRLDEHVRQK